MFTFRATKEKVLVIVHYEFASRVNEREKKNRTTVRNRESDIRYTDMQPEFRLLVSTYIPQEAVDEAEEGKNGEVDKRKISIFIKPIFLRVRGDSTCSEF